VADNSIVLNHFIIYELNRAEYDMVSHNLVKVLNFSSLLEKCLNLVKRAQSWYFKIFWPRTKLHLSRLVMDRKKRKHVLFVAMYTL